MKLTHSIFRIIVPFLLVFGFFSCEDYLNQDELEDQLYLQKSGLVDAEIFNWGTFTYNLPVIKSGKGNHTATVELYVDETILSTFNEVNGTNYVLLPENCYIIKESVINFLDEDYRKMFLIDFKPENLIALQGDGKTYVLPCHMRTINTNINIVDDSKAEVIIIPSVLQPYIGFEVPDFYSSGSEFSIKTDDDDILEIYPKVQVNFYNNQDITYNVDVDPNVLKAYNIANSTNYMLLPEAAYVIDKSSCVLKKNRDYEYLHITLKENALRKDEENFMFGNYALPMKITGVSKYGIDPKAATTIYPVSIQPPILDVNWIVGDTLPGGIKSCNSVITDEIENATSIFTADKVIDGDPNVYWSTRAVKPIQFPYYVTISLQEDCKLYRMGFQLPDDLALGNLKTGYFEVSKDGKEWKKVADWSRSNNETERTTIVDCSMTHAKFIRLVITDAFIYSDPAIGKSGGAVCQIGEINVWGI